MDEIKRIAEDLDIDYCVPYNAIGVATTTNDTVVNDTKKNPIGFIWPKEST